MTTTIEVRKNGSLRIEGDFVIKGFDGEIINLEGRTVVSLCRCGQTKNRPFCDGTHKQCGFTDEPA